MEAGAMGGIGGATMSLGAAASTAASGAPAASAGSSLKCAAPGMRQAAIELQQLAEKLKDFSSAEILLALMLSRAGDKCQGKQGGGEALWGMLAGMALAGQMAQMAGQMGCAAPAPGFEAGAGLSLNVQA